MKRNLFSYAMIFFLVALDGLIGVLLFQVGLGLRSVLLVLHLAVALLFVGLFRKIEDQKFVEKQNFTLVALALALALPVYGMLGMTVVHLFVRRSEIPDKSYFTLEQEFLPEDYKVLLKNVDQHVIGITRDEIDIDAFRDIFQGNDKQMEESAINKISQALTKNAVRLLKQVIQTTTSDTRVMAASALIEMEGRVVKRIEALRERLKDKPNEPETVLQLARIYDLYCYLDVLEPALERHYQNMAIQQYELFLLYNPEHQEANLEYGRILLNSGRNQEAIRVLNRIRHLSPDEFNSRIWLAEAHYNEADFANVRSICQELAAFETLPEKIRDVVKLWTPAEESAEA